MYLVCYKHLNSRNVVGDPELESISQSPEPKIALATWNRNVDLEPWPFVFIAEDWLRHRRLAAGIGWDIESGCFGC